jgi:hypothetical protein
MAIAAEQVLACTTCGEGAFGAGMQTVYLLHEVPGPLFHCAGCDAYSAGESKCWSCGRFMKRIAEYGCPDQELDNVRHETEVVELYQCPICAEHGTAIAWFDKSDIDDHLAMHADDEER